MALCLYTEYNNLQGGTVTPNGEWVYTSGGGDINVSGTTYVVGETLQSSNPCVDIPIGGSYLFTYTIANQCASSTEVFEVNLLEVDIQDLLRVCDFRLEFQNNATDQIVNAADITLINDSIVFNVDHDCVAKSLSPLCDINGQQEIRTPSMQTDAKIDIQYVIDLSGDVISGVSYIESIDLISNLTGTFQLNFPNPPPAGSALIYDSANPLNWASAIQSEMLAQLSLLGYTNGLDFILNVIFDSSSDTINIIFRVKHNPVGEWIGISNNASSQLSIANSLVYNPEIRTTDLVFTCTESICGANQVIKGELNESYIDFVNTDFDVIVLLLNPATIDITQGSNDIQCEEYFYTASLINSPCSGSEVFQWFLDGSALTGETSSTLGTGLNNTGTYTVEITCNGVTCSESIVFT